MTLLSIYRIDVLESFKALKHALAMFETALQGDQHLPGWFEPPKEISIAPHADLRHQAFAMIKQLEYLDTQKPREILVGAGLFGASEATLKTISHLNQCKDHFKLTVIALKKAKIKLNDDLLCEHFEPLLDKRSETMASHLKKMGLARLHLKQCYRRIPIFQESPLKVSWTWAHTRAITRISVEQAKVLLLKQGKDFGIELQLQKLSALKASEPLAIVQELAPHLRANVVFEKDERRVMVKGPVPLFYRAENSQPTAPLPKIRPPGFKSGKNTARRIRSDVKLDPLPFLPAIRAHRYLQ